MNLTQDSEDERVKAHPSKKLKSEAPESEQGEEYNNIRDYFKKIPVRGGNDVSAHLRLSAM